MISIFVILVALGAIITLSTINDCKRRSMKLRESLEDTRRGLWISFTPPVFVGLVVVPNPLTWAAAAGGLVVFGVAIDKILKGVEWAAETDLQDLLKRFAAPQVGAGMTTTMNLMATAAAEHRPKIIVHQEEGGSDSDDGDGNHVEQVEERDQPQHEGQKLTWVELLAKLEALRVEFYAIKNGKEDTASASQRVMD